MRKARTQTLLCLALMALPLVCALLLNYLVDPLQLYRRQAHPHFWNNMWFQDAGLIHSYLPDPEYDSVIMGNSVIACFTPSRVAKAMGWKKTLKLTIRGAQTAEQRYVLDQVLEQPHITRIFWGHRAVNLQIPEADRWHPTQPLPRNLYTRSLFDDTSYLLSLDTLKNSIKLVLGRSLGPDWTTDQDLLGYWMDGQRVTEYANYDTSAKFKKTLARVKKRKGNRTLKLKKQKPGDYPAATKHVIELVRAHPEREFVMFFAPHSRLSLKSMSPKALRRYYGVQKMLVEELADAPNCRFFGFEDQDLIVANLANYRDDIHYHSGVNQLLAENMGQGENLLTPGNIDGYITRCTAPLQDYTPRFDYAAMVPMLLESERTLLAKALAEKGEKTSAALSGRQD